MAHQNQLSLETEKQVKNILTPLTKSENIHYFCYGVNYDDGRGFTLSSNSQYYESWFKHKFPMVGFHLDAGWYSWDGILPQKQLDVANKLEIGNGLIYIHHNTQRTECFGFASNPENKAVMNFYLNNRNLLKKFMRHFKESANDLIEEGKAKAVLPSPEMMINNRSFSEKDKGLLKDLGSDLQTLSVREWECYRLLLQGLTIAEIGKELDITKPTVAVYISRVKHKLKCFSRKEMMQKAAEELLLEYNFE